MSCDTLAIDADRGAALAHFDTQTTVGRVREVNGSATDERIAQRFTFRCAFRDKRRFDSGKRGRVIARPGQQGAFANAIDVWMVGDGEREGGATIAGFGQGSSADERGAPKVGVRAFGHDAVMVR